MSAPVLAGIGKLQKEITEVKNSQFKPFIGQQIILSSKYESLYVDGNSGTEFLREGFGIKYNTDYPEFLKTNSRPVDTATYSNISSTMGNSNTILDIEFNSSFSKAYLSLDNGRIRQYDVVNEDDVSEWTYDNLELVVASRCVRFSSDRSKAYILTSSEILQYTVNNENDISTWTQDASSLTLSSINSVDAEFFAFNYSTNKFFVFDRSADQIYQFSVVDEYDVSTWTYDSLSRSLDLNTTSMFFSSDYSYAYTVSQNTDLFKRFEVIDPLDVTTWSPTGDIYDVTPINGTPQMAIPDPSGTKLYLSGGTEVYQLQFISSDVIYNLPFSSFNSFSDSSNYYMRIR